MPTLAKRTSKHTGSPAHDFSILLLRTIDRLPVGPLVYGGDSVKNWTTEQLGKWINRAPTKATRQRRKIIAFPFLYGCNGFKPGEMQVFGGQTATGRSVKFPNARRWPSPGLVFDDSTKPVNLDYSALEARTLAHYQWFTNGAPPYRNKLIQALQWMRENDIKPAYGTEDDRKRRIYQLCYGGKF